MKKKTRQLSKCRISGNGGSWSNVIILQTSETETASSDEIESPSSAAFSSLQEQVLGGLGLS